jgi:hypothetical protein
VKLGGEPPVALAKEFGYKHQSGVNVLVKRLEQEATRNSSLEQRLTGIKTEVENVQP